MDKLVEAQSALSAQGLAQAEAQRRLAKFGYNELPEKKRNPLLDFLSHFWGPIPWMIEAAAILSALVQHWADLVIILVLLLTIFVTRTRGPFWSTCPAPVLLSAVIGTQLIATYFAVFGWLMPPIGWRWALAVWGYALGWFLVNDRIKLVGYRILDPSQSVLAGRN